MRALLIAAMLMASGAALVLSVTAHAADGFDHCYPAAIVLHDGDLMTLNDDGTWTVPDWDAVRREAARPPYTPGDESVCAARALIANRADLRFSPVAPEGTKESCSDASMARVSDADPVMRECFAGARGK